MRVRRYLAADLRAALRLVQEDLGPQAVVLETHRRADGIEIVATMDHAEAEAEHQARLQQRERARRPQPIAEETLLPDWVRQGLEAQAPRPPAVQLVEPAPRQVEAVIHASARPSMPGRDQQLAGLRERLGGHGDTNEDVRAMRAELMALRSQLQALRSNEASPPLDDRGRISERLRQMGLSANVIADLLAPVMGAEKWTADKLWQHCLGKLAKSVRIEAEPELIDRSGILVMLGPTGAGKTTSLAKLAARHVIAHGSEGLALLSTDSYRVGSYEQLEKIASALGVRSALVEPGDRLDSVLASLGRRRLILIDTAGFSRHAAEHLAQQQMLAASRYRMQGQLVLPANLQGAVLQRSYEDFASFRLSGAIISKVDEATSLGETISLLIAAGLPLSYWTHGQRIPEDIEKPSAARLISMAVAMAPRQMATRKAEEVPLKTGRMAKSSHT